MVKKLKKYVKFVVCCALMLSLVAPSYAALSASDGSAFVTKAEFDSALADFNARLTTFEAGINSKIDSQVTSYLDRNGIWSGKVQELNNNVWYFNSTPTVPDDSVISFREEKSATIVNEISKTGLAYLEWSIWGNASNNTWANNWSLHNLTPNHADVSGFHLNMSLYMTFFQNTIERYQYCFGSCNGMETGGTNYNDRPVMAVQFPKDGARFKNLFFVDSKQPLVAMLQGSYNTLYFKSITKGDGKTSVQFDKLTVY